MTKIEMQQHINRLTTELVELRAQVSVLTTERDNAKAVADKFRRDFEDAQRWVGVWKAKAQARSTTGSERRALLAAAKAQAIAEGRVVKVGAQWPGLEV